MPGIVPTESRIAYLNQLRGLDGDLLSIHLHETPQPEDTMSIGYADIEQSSFPGYSPQTALFSSPEVDGDGVVSIVADMLTFTRSTAGLTHTVHGWYITADHIGDGVTLVGIYWFDVPKPVSAAGQEIKVIPRYRLLPPA